MISPFSKIKTVTVVGAQTDRTLPPLRTSTLDSIMAASLIGEDLSCVVFRNLSRTCDVLYFFDCDRNYLYCVDSVYKTMWMQKSKFSCVVNSKVIHCFGSKTRAEVLCVLKKLKFGQDFFGISYIFNIISKMFAMSKACAKGFKDENFEPFLMDLASILISVSTPVYCNWTPAYLVSQLLRFYSLYVRGVKIFSPEAPSFTSGLRPESLDTAMMAILIAALPDKLIDIVKRINLLSGKRLFDFPNLFLDLITYVSEFCLFCLEKIPNVPTMVLDCVRKLFNLGHRKRIVDRMMSSLNRWEKDKRVMMKDDWREEIRSLQELVAKDEYLLEFLKQNVRANLVYKEFTRLVRSLKAYESCSRKEPVCIVFEGPAGIGKSINATQLASVLGKSTYVHTIKPTEDGKDFYDGYNNEEVFVIDDVGQQGISQWRTVINMVSCVKLPLDCAEADLKFTKYFDSELMLLTTNQFLELNGFTKSDCISDKEALFRRCQVFDYTGVVRDVTTGLLEGKVVYKRYDVYQHKVVSSYPTPNMRNIPTSCDVQDNVKLLSWMLAVVQGLQKHFRTVYTSTQLSQDAIERVRIGAFTLRRDAEEDFEEDDDVDVDYTSAAEDLAAESLDTPLISLDSHSSILDSILPDQPSGWSSFDFIYEFFHYYFTYIYDLFSNLIKTVSSNSSLMVLFCFLSMSALFYKLYSDYTSKNKLNGTKTAVDDWRAAMRAESPPVKVKLSGEGTAEVDDSVILPTMVKAVEERMVLLEIPKSRGEYIGYAYAQGLLSGHRILVVGHTFEGCDGVLNVYSNWEAFERKDILLNNIPVKVTWSAPELDVTIISIPEEMVSPFKKCSHFFKPTDKSSVVKPYFVNAGGSVDLSSSLQIGVKDDKYLTPRGVKTLKAKRYVNHHVTSPGLCGSLLVDGCQGIIGMHVAGDSSSRGTAILFCSKTMNKIIDFLSNDKNVDELELNVKVKDNFSGAKFRTDLFQTVPSRTSLVPSPLSEWREPTRFPANLEAHGPKTVKVRSAKSFQPIPHIHPSEREFIKQCLSTFFTKFGDLTDEEVIAGGDGLAPLNKESVNGFGLDKDKEIYIDFENKVLKPEFQEMCDDLNRRVTEGSLNFKDFLFYESLKDELRDEEKVNKPRAFRIGKLTHVYWMKRLLGNLFRHIVKNRRFNQITIGVNPYSDWPEIFEVLQNSHAVFDLDVSEFDGRQASEVQDIVKELCEEYYQGEYPEMLKSVLSSVIRTLVLVLNSLFLTTHSTPSGAWITSLFNSLNNRGYTAGSYYRQCIRRGRKPTVQEFLKLVDFVNGDDKLCATSSELSEYHNALTIKEYLESLGMKCTQGNKEEIVDKFRNIKDVTFLKRHFAYHNDLKKIVGPLAKETLLNSILWCDSRKDTNVVMEGKINSFQREMYLHPDGAHYVNSLRLFCESQSYPFKQLSDSYLKHVFTYECDEAYDDYKKVFNKNF